MKIKNSYLVGEFVFFISTVPVQSKSLAHILNTNSILQ